MPDPIVDVYEKGYPAQLYMYGFVATPSSGLKVLEFTARGPLTLQALEIVPGECGSSGPTGMDVTVDGTTAFDNNTPSIADSDTNGTRQTFIPDAAGMTEVAEGSVIKVAFTTTIGTGMQNFSVCLACISRARV